MFSLKNNQGMSFLEIMVSISIIVIVLSVSVVNYRSANKRAEIIIWADKMVSDIRLMENYAAAVKTYNNDDTRNIWGIHLKKGAEEYVLFNDDYGNDSGNDNMYDSGIDGVYRNINLPNDIIIEEIEMIKSSTIDRPEEASAVFHAPDPTVYLKNHSDENENYEKIIITLRDQFNGSFKKVKINFFGLVEVIE